MALKAYDLPTVSGVVGDFKIRVYSSDTTLTAPTVDTILEIGDKTETVDAALGITELGKLTLRVRDDYSVTSYGFWFAAMNADECYIRIMLNETTDKYFFVGSVQQDATQWEELALYNSTFIRVATITVVDMMSVMLDSAVADWQAEIITHQSATGTSTDQTPSHVVTLAEFFASLLKSSGLNASFSASDVSFIYDPSNVDFDFFYDPGGGEEFFTLEDVLIATSSYSTGPVLAPTNYFYSSSDYELRDLFSTARELLPVALRNFGCALRMSYDSSTETASALGTHKMQIIQRGRAYADASNLVFAKGPKSSVVSKSFDMLGDAVIFRLPPQSDSSEYMEYMSRRFYGTTLKTATDPATIPDYIAFDIDSLHLFSTGWVGADVANIDRAIWVVDSGGNYVNPTVRMWNYETGTTTDLGLLSALVEYYFYRFTAVFGKITRTYGGITASDGSTTSFQHLSILRRTSINPGPGAGTYYANRVTINPNTAETEIEWFFESN